LPGLGHTLVDGQRPEHSEANALNKAHTETPGPVLRGLLSLQLGATLLSAIGWWLGSGSDAALAAVAGGLAVVLPTLGFAAIALTPSAGSSPKRMLSAFYRGEAVKIAMTAVLFAVLVQWLHTQLLPLLATFVMVTFLYWPALLFTQGAAAGRLKNRVQQP
jgi:ATP synthase protein I